MGMNHDEGAYISQSWCGCLETEGRCSLRLSDRDGAGIMMSLIPHKVINTHRALVIGYSGGHSCRDFGMGCG